MREHPHGRGKHERERAHDALREIIDSPASDKEKIATILAYTGAKPMSQISIVMRHDGEHEIAGIRHELRRLGLSVDEQIEETVRGNKMRFRFSRDSNVIETMRSLERKPGYVFSADYHAAIGRLLGFPPTAITAFLGHRDMIDSLPDEVRDTPLGRFMERGVMMRLSKDHWREELKVIQKWYEAAYAAAPEYVSYLISDDWIPPGSAGH